MAVGALWDGFEKVPEANHCDARGTASPGDEQELRLSVTSDAAASIGGAGPLDVLDGGATAAEDAVALARVIDEAQQHHLRDAVEPATANCTAGEGVAQEQQAREAEEVAETAELAQEVNERAQIGTLPASLTSGQAQALCGLQAAATDSAENSFLAGIVVGGGEGSGWCCSAQLAQGGCGHIPNSGTAPAGSNIGPKLASGGTLVATEQEAQEPRQPGPSLVSRTQAAGEPLQSFAEPVTAGSNQVKTVDQPAGDGPSSNECKLQCKLEERALATSSRR